MDEIKVSIIMPAYNQEKYIEEAIQSVVDQTYSNWELIVVNDGSVDGTADIVAGFTDERIRCIHQPNKGVCEARNVGIKEADGEYVAFLDADDLFHPDKLKVQVECLNTNSEIGLVFVSRIEIDQDGKPLNFYSYGDEVTLASVVLSFPFAPSDLLLRREWLHKVGGFDSSYVINEDREWYIRLVKAGCRCKNLKNFLSYRRLDSRKLFHNLSAKMADMQNALQAAYGDSSFSSEIQSVKNRAYLNIFLGWMYQATIQGDFALAQDYFDHGVEFAPALMDGSADEWTGFMLHTALRDGGDHEGRLRSIFEQFAKALSQTEANLEKLISRGYLLNGVREVIWGRDKEANGYLMKVNRDETHLDEEISSIITDILMNYEIAFGTKEMETVSISLFDKLQKIFGRKGTATLAGVLLINQAFSSYRNMSYLQAIRKTARAVSVNPAYSLNRGVLSMFFRSVFHGLFGLAPG